MGRKMNKIGNITKSIICCCLMFVFILSLVVDIFILKHL